MADAVGFEANLLEESVVIAPCTRLQMFDLFLQNCILHITHKSGSVLYLTLQ